jgi:hypothetical protein
MGDDDNEEEENILNMEALNKMNNITNNKVKISDINFEFKI